MHNRFERNTEIERLDDLAMYYESLIEAALNDAELIEKVMEKEAEEKEDKEDKEIFKLKKDLSFDLRRPYLVGSCGSFVRDLYKIVASGAITKKDFMIVKALTEDVVYTWDDYEFSYKFEEIEGFEKIGSVNSIQIPVGGFEKNLCFDANVRLIYGNDISVFEKNNGSGQYFIKVNKSSSVFALYYEEEHFLRVYLGDLAQKNKGFDINRKRFPFLCEYEDRDFLMNFPILNEPLVKFLNFDDFKNLCSSSDPSIVKYSIAYEKVDATNISRFKRYCILTVGRQTDKTIKSIYNSEYVYTFNVYEPDDFVKFELKKDLKSRLDVISLNNLSEAEKQLIVDSVDVIKEVKIKICPIIKNGLNGANKTLFSLFEYGLPKKLNARDEYDCFEEANSGEVCIFDRTSSGRHKCVLRGNTLYLGIQLEDKVLEEYNKNYFSEQLKKLGNYEAVVFNFLKQLPYGFQELVSFLEITESTRIFEGYRLTSLSDYDYDDECEESKYITRKCVVLNGSFVIPKASGEFVYNLGSEKDLYDLITKNKEKFKALTDFGVIVAYELLELYSPDGQSSEESIPIWYK